MEQFAKNIEKTWISFVGLIHLTNSSLRSKVYPNSFQRYFGSKNYHQLSVFNQTIFSVGHWLTIKSANIPGTIEITMVFWILLLAFKNVSFLQGLLYQEQYHRIENCINNVLSSTSTFSAQNTENLFSCMKQCQINLSCQSFAFKPTTTQCL